MTLPEPFAPPAAQQHGPSGVVETGYQPPTAGRSGRLLTITALVVAIAAAGVSAAALTHRSASQPPSAPIEPTPPRTAAPNEVTAAKREACDAWRAASKAMVAARSAFVNSPPAWDDPVTVRSLSEAESGILIQVEYLRQHIAPAAPPSVAGAIAEYISATIDMVAAYGQHAAADVANAAAQRGIDAAAKVRSVCG